MFPHRGGQGIFNEKRDLMKGKRRLAVILIGSMILSLGAVAFAVDAPEAKIKGAETITVYQGKSTSLSITEKGKKIKTGKKYRYQVSNRKIATISAKGRVKGKKAGTTKATLQKKSNKKKIKIKIKVVNYVKELRLATATNLMMQKGDKKKIQATVYPKTAKNRKVTYSSSGKSVVTVSSAGTIQAVGSGFATITVKTKGTTKKGKKISKKIQIYVTEGSSPVPTPVVPDKGATVLTTPTPTGTPDRNPSDNPNETPSDNPNETPTVTPTTKPSEPPKTLEQMIREIPEPDSSTLVAANFVVKSTDGAVSTLYFINRGYQGQMHVAVDGMDMASSSGVMNILHRLATEVTGKGTSVSVNPGNKQENKYYDEELKRWRDAILVTRPTLADAWLITNRKNGQQYRLMAWEQDQTYGTPYGLIITAGDTSSKIVVY